MRAFDQSYLSVNWQDPINWQHPLNRGLVGWWLVAPHWSGGTTWRDLTGRHHGTLTNMDPATDWVGPGDRLGGWGALDFDGNNDYITNNSFTDIGNEFSVSTRVKSDDTAQDETFAIVVKNGKQGPSRDFKFLIQDDGSGNLRIHIGDGSSSALAGSFNYTAGEWFHVVSTYNGSTLRFYIDGTLQDSTSTSLTTFTTSLLEIGGGVNGAEIAADFWDGQIDDVRIHNRALSPVEVAEYYQRSKAGYLGLLNRPRRRYYTVEVSVGAFELSVDPGSYVITGISADLLANRILDANTGSYTITGSTADLLAAFVESVTAGAYTLSGAQADLLTQRLLDASTGGYAVTGNAADLLAGFPTNADPGVYSITGASADLLAGYLTNADPGSYATTGNAADLLANRLVEGQPGSYATTGVSAETLAGRVIDALTGSYTQAGIDAALTITAILDGDPGTYTKTGVAADLVHTESGAFEISADPGSYAVTGQSADLQAHYVESTVAGVYGVTGNPATLLRGGSISATAGSYAVTGSSAGLLAARLATADPGVYTLTGVAADLVKLGAFGLDVDAGSYATTGSPATLLAQRLETLNAGAYAVSGVAATLDFSGAVDVRRTVEADATFAKTTEADATFGKTTETDVTF